jgi:hypothetical protein
MGEDPEPFGFDRIGHTVGDLGRCHALKCAASMAFEHLQSWWGAPALGRDHLTSCG